MQIDLISAVGIASFFAAGVWFLSRPKRADDLRAYLPKMLRGRGTEDPFYPFRRWTWSGVPSHWRSALITSVIAAFVFGAMAIWFSTREAVLPLVLFTLSYALFHVIHAWRITRKVFGNQA